MRVNSDEILDAFAKKRVADGLTLEQAVADVPQPDRRYFAKAYRDFKAPKTTGEAMGRGLGGVYKQILDPLNIPVALLEGATYDWLPAAQDKVVETGKSAVDMLKKVPEKVGGALDRLGQYHSGELTEGARQGGGMSGRSMGQQMGDTATGGWTNPTSIQRLILDEVLNWDNEEITQLRLELQEADDDGREGGRIDRNLEIAIENHRPYTTLIGRTVKSELTYWFDRQALLNKVAEEPHVVMSDFMSAVAIIASRGAAVPALARTNTGRAAIKVLQSIEKGADWADPFNLPHKGFQKAKEVDHTRRVGPDVNMTNQPRSFQYGRDDQGNPLEGQMLPDKAAEEFGAGVENTPDDVRNKQPIFQTQEWARSETQGEVGQKAQERVKGTLDAIDSSKTRMLDDLNTTGNPLDAETGSQNVIALYNARQDKDALEVKDLFKQWNQNYQSKVSPEFGLEDKLRELVKDLRGGGARPSDRKAAGVLEGEIDAMVEGGVPLNDMPMDKLDKLRTFFREAYDSSFMRPPTAAEMGAGSEGGKAYMALTDLLYDAVRDTVRRSGGAIPPTLESGLRAAKRRRMEIAKLETSEGGKFLLKTKNRPRALIDGLLNKDDVTTTEIQNIYKLLGGDGVTELQPIILHRMFENMGKQPDGLKKYLVKIKAGRDTNRIVELFGGGAKGKDVSEKLHEFAEFSAEMMTTVRRLSNSPTGKMVYFVEGAKAGIVGAITGGLGDLAQAVIWKQELNAGLMATVTTLNLLKQFAPELWKHVTVNSDWARKRLLEGHELHPFVGQALDLMIEGSKRQFVKPAEKVMGAKQTAEQEAGISFGEDDSFIESYIQRGGKTPRQR